MSDTELLKHSKYNFTVYWTMIVSGLPNFIRIVCWIFFNLLLRRIMMTNFNFQISMRTHVWHTAFTTLRIELYRVVDYDTNFFKFHS